MSSTALVPSLVRPSSRAVSLVADAVLVAIGVALIGLSAQVTFHLPNTPVPFTGQTFAVLLVGGAYGATRGFATMAAYLVVGGLGYGVFAQHASGLGRPQVLLGHRRLPGRHAGGGHPGRLAGRPRLGPQGACVRCRR